MLVTDPGEMGTIEHTLIAGVEHTRRTISPRLDPTTKALR